MIGLQDPNIRAFWSDQFSMPKSVTREIGTSSIQDFNNSIVSNPAQCHNSLDIREQIYFVRKVWKAVSDFEWIRFIPGRHTSTNRADEDIPQFESVIYML
jgi:hypothetical protein